MPLDPSIPLQVKPLQLPDVGQQYLQSQHLAMQRQLQQQQLESGSLDIAAKRKEVGAQDTLGKLLSSHTEITPEGELKTDHGAVVKGLADAGYGAKALAYDAQRRADLKSALDAQELKTKIAGEKAGRLGSLAGSVPRVDWTAPDAAQQAQQAQVAVKRALDQALAEGLLDQEHVKGLESQPYSPELEAQIQQFGTEAMKSKEQHDAHVADLAEIRNKQELEIKQAAEKRAAEKAPYELGALKEQESIRKTADYAKTLAAAASKGPDALAAEMSRIYLKDPAGFQKFGGLTAQSKPEEILAVATTPEQRIQAGMTAARNAQLAKSEEEQRDIGRANVAVSQGRLELERKKNEMEYGAGTREFWVHQLQDNPDTVKDLPPAMRAAVGKDFTAATGLPLPKPVSPTTQTQETAARNALDGTAFIRQALQNPEIRKQIGPIMGRLGNAEAKVGSAVGLSPQAEQLAQELRTRMRYFVFQEGKAVLGGRLPQQLMKELEASSARVTMDPNMLLGAIKGAEDNAGSVLDNADKERFNGKMRSREMRGQAAQVDPKLKAYADEYFGGDVEKAKAHIAEQKSK